MESKVITTMMITLFLASMLSITPVAARSWEKTYWFYGNHGWAFNFSHGNVHAMDINDSSFGPHDVLIIYDSYFVAVTDNEESAELWRNILPPIFDVCLVDPGELEVRGEGKSFFVELTVPCGNISARKIMIEGYGPVKPGNRTRHLPSGYTIRIFWGLGFDALSVCGLDATDTKGWEYTGDGLVAFSALMKISGPP